MSNTEPNLLFEIDDFPHYFVGTDLNIYSEKRGKIKKMKQNISGKRYYMLSLFKEGKKYYKIVHRLIAETFIPNPHNLPEVDHINGHKTDNRLENLRWVSASDNQRNRNIDKDNKTEHQGVCFDTKRKQWRATWRDKQGKSKGKSFSINKYGDNEAKQLAIEYRQQMVDEYYNRLKD